MYGNTHQDARQVHKCLGVWAKIQETPHSCDL
jgi:hypothetical protein